MRRLLMAGALVLTASSASAQSFPSMNIAAHCQQQWGADYNMQDFCRSKQQGAEQRSGQRVIAPEIAAHCSQQWPDDWNMFEFCVNKQEQAKLRLER